MDSAAHYRKIDLQSPSDLTYLVDNIKQAAREKIDLAIPPSAAPDGEDAYRTKVEELVNEYIIQTLTLALPSLRVNGLDPTPSILRPAASVVTSANTTSKQPTLAPSPTPSELSAHVYEAYDPRLAEQLRALYATFDDESTKVAELRREAPRAAARAHVEALEKELVREKDTWEAMKKEHEGQSEEQRKGEFKSESGLQLGNGLERRDEVEKMWKRGTEGLIRLGGVTEIMARLERAEKALEAVEGG